VASTPPLSLAPLWRRSLAWLIDFWNIFAVATAGTGALVSGAVLIGEFAERNAPFNGWLDRWVLRTDQPESSPFTLPARWRPALFGVGLADAILRRNRRTYGQAAMRLRRVDASTGGPVSIRSAIVRYVVSALISALAKRVTARANQRWRERLNALKPEIAELGRKHPEDLGPLLRDLWALARKRGADPFAPVKASIATQTAAHFLCMLLAPKQQGLSDVVAGIATVRETQTTGSGGSGP
jgi:uncharacterized RDD family membrane protein YckC